MSVNCTKDYEITVNLLGNVTLLSYWKLEETGVGDTRDDAHGSNDLPTAGDVFGQAAKVNNGAYWDINAGYTGSLLNNTANSPLWVYASGFTICGWFRSSGIVAGDAGDVLRLSGADWQIQMRKAAGSLNLVFTVTAEGNQSSRSVSGMNNSGFNFFRYWHDPADGLVHVKINEGATQDALVATPAATLDPCTLITAELIASQAFAFHYLDEFGIWQGVMDDSGGAYLYNSGNGRTYPDVPGV